MPQHDPSIAVLGLPAAIVSRLADLHIRTIGEYERRKSELTFALKKTTRERIERGLREFQEKQK